MFRIHISRDRRMLGEFTPLEVAEGLKNGTYLATDLGWREPMDAWKPLGEFDDLPSVQPPELELPDLAEVEDAPASMREPAWERRSELGVFPAIVETIRQIYSAPAAVFRDMAVNGGFKAPLFFYLIVATVASWVSAGYELATVMVNPESVSRAFGGMVTPSAMIGTQIAAIFLTPIMLLLKAFLAAGIFHGILLAIGGAKNGYEATLRAYCYAAGAASIMLFIPVCGKLVAIVLTVGLVVIAVREAHRTNAARAIGAVVPPVIIGYALLIALYAVLLAAYTAQAPVK